MYSRLTSTIRTSSIGGLNIQTSYSSLSSPFLSSSVHQGKMVISALCMRYPTINYYSTLTSRPKNILLAIVPQTPSSIVSSNIPFIICRYRHDRNVKIRKPYNKPLLYTEDEIEEIFTKGSGRGGQSVAKTNNCVILIHKPTNTMVRCHKTRSRDLNRQAARRELQLQLDELVFGKDSIRGKLYEKLRKRKQKLSKRKKLKYHSQSKNNQTNEKLENKLESDNQLNTRQDRRRNYYQSYQQIILNPILKNKVWNKYYQSYQNKLFGSYRISKYYIRYTPLWKQLWLPNYQVFIRGRYTKVNV